MKWFVILIVSLVALLSVTFVVAESQGLMESEFITGHLTALQEQRGSLLVGVIIAALLAGDLFLPVPSSIVMTLSGFFLGTVSGTFISFGGSMVSAVLGFWLCRLFGQRAFRRLAGERDTTRIANLLETYGAWAIILSRSAPMLTEVMSCIAGLSLMSFRRFLLLSAAGTLPVCIVYAWAGSRGAPGGFNVVPALFVAFLIPALGFAVVHRLQRQNKTSNTNQETIR